MKMRLFICLFLLSLCGIGWLVAPESIFHLKPVGEGAWLGQWGMSVSAFAVPLTLAFLRFLKGKTIPILSFLWGLWMTFLSLACLAQIRAWAPGVTSYGVLFLLFVFVTSLGIVLSALLALFAKKKVAA